jgi:biopolymer transport protein ExbD
MPVHKAGPRLYHSVPFKHLVKKSAGGPRASNISLNLTPFVDMMTILVTFLLMVFSSTGQLLQAQKGLELPMAESRDTLQLAPVIIVT